ncbi:MAG TPA: DUF2934 domain-containing protein [Nitrospira sp.]|nr:DUF2934 domain-containing protein [Nitrospira sp.]MCW5794773.1 DUF2934 domain-containing protein [Nitrospira sp.]HMW84681.1 DUF2934 domain-containing protein [Nitrospira sp.]HMX89873.1 DUF2934 domain-containing protein [Nitrospira sp.]HMZ95610.1 DUF2934 domain-containing protein [Nitrospira sp.]
MPERNAQAPAGDEPIRNISRGATSRSIPKRKDRLQPSPQAETTDTAEDIRTRIEKLAYARYQQRGQQDGYDYEDWLEAERIVQGESAPQSGEGSGRSGTHALHSA